MIPFFLFCITITVRAKQTFVWNGDVPIIFIALFLHNFEVHFYLEYIIGEFLSYAQNKTAQNETQTKTSSECSGTIEGDRASEREGVREYKKITLKRPSPAKPCQKETWENFVSTFGHDTSAQTTKHTRIMNLNAVGSMTFGYFNRINSTLN